MPLLVLQPSTFQPTASVCAKACANCPSRNRSACDPKAPCPGYGSSKACPPMIVLAVIESGLRSLVNTELPAFGSRREVA